MSKEIHQEVDFRAYDKKPNRDQDVFLCPLEQPVNYENKFMFAIDVGVLQGFNKVYMKEKDPYKRSFLKRMRDTMGKHIGGLCSHGF